MYIVSVF